MLSPRLTNCVECSDISTLLSDIDCKLNELASVLYNNTVFSLNLSVPEATILDLLNYKRILTFKVCNPNYAKKYTVKMIASRVKLLTSGLRNCCSKKSQKPIDEFTTTTTTTPYITTTTSTSSPIGCQCYELSFTPIEPPFQPLVYIPCGGGSPVSITSGTNKYCVSSIVSVGDGTATPIVGSSCTNDGDCRPCRCYQITFNNIANTVISYTDCNDVLITNRLITQDTRLCARENSIYFTNPANLIVTDVTDCSNCSIYPSATGGPFSISWATTVDNPCNPTPWTILPNNLVVRYDLSDSLNCGGTCDFKQAGKAIATVQTGPTDLNLTITVTGLAELQLPSYERLAVVIDGIEYQTYMSQGGLLGCVMGAPVSVTYTPGPYTFLAGSAHTIELDFDSMDQNFHVGAFYEITLTFT